MRKVIVTNNPMVKEKYDKLMKVDFVDAYGYFDVLDTVRRHVHNGWIIETHPLSGSIKPNETPYKSVVLQPVKEGAALDFSSLNLIEEAIQTFRKFQSARSLPQWTEKAQKDFQMIDLSLIDSALPSMGLRHS